MGYWGLVMSKCELCHMPDAQHRPDCIQQIIEDRDRYWIVVKYFQQEGNKSERDIVKNLMSY